MLQEAIRSKTFDEYDWTPLIDSGEISGLKVFELNKYLRHYGLGVGGHKKEKVRRIMAHHLKSHAPTRNIIRFAEMSIEDDSDPGVMQT